MTQAPTRAQAASPVVSLLCTPAGRESCGCKIRFDCLTNGASAGIFYSVIDDFLAQEKRGRVQMQGYGLSIGKGNTHNRRVFLMDIGKGFKESREGPVEVIINCLNNKQYEDASF